MAQTQTAIAVTEIGKPVTQISRPIPSPKDDEVLIKVTIAGLNPHDAKARDWGLFSKGHLPAVLGADVVGIVTGIGPNVTRFKEGDHVFGQASLLGENLGGVFNFGPPNWDTAGLQEYAILECRFAARVPVEISDAQAATLPTNLITAVVGLFDSAALGLPAPWDAAASGFNYKDTSILILGGGSNTGKFAIQAATLAGVGTIIVVAGLRSAEEVKNLGATHVIDRTKSATEVAAEVREIVGDTLIYAFDAINPVESQHVGVEALSNTKTGKFARLLPLGPVDESKLSAKKEAGFETLNVLGISTGKPDIAIPLWERVAGWLEDGKIKPTPYQIVKGSDVDAVNGILDEYSNGSASGHWQVHF